MDATGRALAELAEVEADLWRALRYLAGAEPRVWRSPAARAYQARLDELGGDLRRLQAVARQVLPAVVAAGGGPSGAP